jgi:hypothetical protein
LRPISNNCLVQITPSAGPWGVPGCGAIGPQPSRRRAAARTHAVAALWARVAATGGRGAATLRASPIYAPLEDEKQVTQITLLGNQCRCRSISFSRPCHPLMRVTRQRWAAGCIKYIVSSLLSRREGERGSSPVKPASLLSSLPRSSSHSSVSSQAGGGSSFSTNSPA